MITLEEYNAIRAHVEVASNGAPPDMAELAVSGMAKLKAILDPDESFKCLKCGNGTVGHFGECSNCGDIT